MPLRALTGFEFGTTAGAGVGNAGNKIFDVVNGTVAFNTGAAARTGTYGYHHDTNNATQGVKWNTDTLGTSQTRLLTAFWFRFPGALPDHDTPFWAMHCVGPDMAGWYVSARDGRTTKLALSFDDITYFYCDAVNIVADTWYQVEAHWDASVSTTPITWRVNGVNATTATSGSAADTIAEVELGYINNLRTFICDYDDWAVWTDTATIPFPGRQKVVQLIPDIGSSVTVNGATTNWNTFAGATPTETAWNATTALTAVDEVPPNLGSAQDGFQQIVNATTAYVEVPLTTYTLAAGETVTGARLLVPGWAATTTAATIGFRSFNGTTETTLFAAADPNFDNTSTPAWVCKMLTTADVDTQAELDALAIRVGFSGGTSPHIGIHAVYVEVAITEATTTNVGAVGPGFHPGRGPTRARFLQRAGAFPAGDTAVALTDTATAADALAVASSIPVADTGTGTDALAVTAALGLTDAGTAVDTSAVAASAPLTEAGSAADAAAVTATVSLSDTGAAADSIAAGVPIAVTEAGSATDAIATTAAAPLADSPTAVDTLGAAATLAVSDTATATDSIAVTVTLALADTGSGTDIASVLAAAALAEAGAILDALGITVLASLAEAGGGADVLVAQTGGGSTPKALTDTGTARDRIHVILTRPDTGLTPRPDTGLTPQPDTGITYYQ